MTDALRVPEREEAIALYDGDGIDEFVKTIVQECGNLPKEDLQSKASRQRVASAAHTVAKIKVAVDDAGKACGEEVRKKLDTINARRRKAREALQEAQDEVRKPLTEWEGAEAARVERIEARMGALRAARELPFGATSEDIEARISELPGIFGNEPYGDREVEAVALRDEAEAKLSDALKTAKEYEESERQRAAERAELDRLRREEDARKAREAEEERERRAAEERARIEKEASERAEREAAARLAAAEDARKEADRRAKIAEDAAKREAEARAKMEREREQAEKARREATKRQTEAAVRKAEKAIGGLTDPTPANIVSAIRAGLIPHVIFDARAKPNA